MKKNPSCLLISAIASVMLTACGGGGSSNPSPPASSSSSSSSSKISNSLVLSSSSSSVLASVSSSVNSSSSSSSSVFVNTVPVFTSATSLSVSEGSKSTGYTATASDADKDVLTFSISGGDDKNQFAIDSATGSLSFVAAPVFDQPADSNDNNVYSIAISAIDSHGGIATQTIEITVTAAPRVLTDVNVENAGSLLTASVNCDGCKLSSTTYEWFLGGNDAPVATGNSYKLLPADQLKTVTVKAIPISTSGAPAKPEMAEFSFNKVEKVVFARGIGAALKTNGEAVIWGKGENGDQDYREVVENVDRIIEPDANDPVYAIAAIKADTSLVTWGDSDYGGGINDNSSAMNVSDAFGGRFIVAFNEDNSVSRFGKNYGIGKNTAINFDDLKNIRQIVTGKGGGYYSRSEDLYVIDSNDAVTPFCWSALHYCADTSDVDLTGVEKIIAGRRAYAALKKDGTLVSWGWGQPYSWSLIPKYEEYDATELKVFPDNAGITDITPMIVTNGYDIGSSHDYVAAFAALRKNGEVITWGSKAIGGAPTDIDLSNVESLFATEDSFAARKNDGSVVVWKKTGKVIADNVKSVASNSGYYAAIKIDGSVGYWDSDGEDRTEDLVSYKYDDEGNLIDTEMLPLTNVKELISGKYSFTALKEDGSVYVLGRSSDNADPVFTNIVNVFRPQRDTYAGLDAEGNLRIWGDLDYVGDVPEEKLAPELIELSSTLN